MRVQGNSITGCSGGSGGSGGGSSKEISALDVKADGLIGTVPAGYVIDKILIVEKGGSPANLNLGNVAFGNQIMPDIAIAANSSNPFNFVYTDNATIAAFDIYISNTLAWVGVFLDVYVILCKIK